MLDEIQAVEAAMSHLYVRSRRHTLQTFWIDYMDQVAAQIQARPCLWSLLWTDPELALKCYLGPCLPAQYRLVGPGSWSGARQFILSALCGGTKFKLRGSPCGSCAGSDSGATVCQANESTLCHCPVAGPPRTAQEGSTADHRTPQTSQGPSGSRDSSLWTTFAFYVVAMAICCVAWLLSVVCNQAESLLNVVDKQLPLVD
ncbi:hypothetical protein BsWGS_22157 [Bradybaena similaris]